MDFQHCDLSTEINPPYVFTNRTVPHGDSLTVKPGISITGNLVRLIV